LSADLATIAIGQSARRFLVPVPVICSLFAFCVRVSAKAKHGIDCGAVSLSLENLVVVMVKTRNPLNLGAVARAMSNFGARELRAVQPFGKAWREANSAVGAGEVMGQAREFATIAEAVADCSLVVGTTSVGNRELKHPLHDLTEAAPLLRERMARGKVAMLFGSEKWGLSNEDLSYCHWLLRITAREEHRSMNLGQAAAVVLYEMGRETAVQSAKLKVQSKPKKDNAESAKARSSAGRRKSGEEKPAPSKPEGVAPELAPMDTVERIGEALLEALLKSGYVGPRRTELAEEKLRRMLRRFSMSAADAEVLLGMVKKIEKELK
jgi:tRNA/rRNA methyltransferase